MVLCHPAESDWRSYQGELYHMNTVAYHNIVQIVIVPFAHLVKSIRQVRGWTEQSDCTRYNKTQEP